MKKPDKGLNFILCYHVNNNANNTSSITKFCKIVEHCIIKYTRVQLKQISSFLSPNSQKLNLRILRGYLSEGQSIYRVVLGKETQHKQSSSY